MVNPFEETLMAGRGSPHLNPSDYTFEPPSYGMTADKFNVSPVDRPTFLPQDASIVEEFNLPFSSIDANLRRDPIPTQEEKIIRGIWPLMRKHAPEWSKDIYRDIKGGWEGSSLNPNINPRRMNQGLPGLQLSQSKWRQQDNMEITIDDLIQRPEFEGWTRDEIKGWLYNQARASRGGIIGLL